jgi:polyisoprenoid-binding protein YceI
MHGVKKVVTLPLKKLGEGPGPGGGYRSGFMYDGKLLRSDFGMTNMVPAIGDEVAITISFEGVRK